MRVLIAQNSGFCFGVRRAVDMAEALANPGRTVYTWGNIIHNEQVVSALEAKNVRPVRALSALAAGDTLIVRAHGAPPALYAECAEKGLRVADATCPFVKRIHRIAEREAAEGRTVLIAGEAAHPEVIGIRGWAEQASGGRPVFVPETAEDAEKLPALGDCSLVAQTTLAAARYEAIVSAVRKRAASLRVFDTICDTTKARQREAEALSALCTKVLVIGSESSANTRRLARLCQKHCRDVKTIDDMGKLSLDLLQSDDIIGVVAGASTPYGTIREVIQVMSELENTTIETVEAEAPAEEVVVTEAPTQEEQPQAVAEAPAAEVTQAPETAEQAAPAAEPAPAVESAPEQETDAEGEEASEFAKAFEKTMTRIRNGQVIKGTVISVVDGEVYVNIGYKSDGFVPKSEFSSDPDQKPEEMLKEGDEIDVEVIKVNDGEGNVLLSRKNVEGKKLWDDLVNDEDLENKVFEAVGREAIKGGVIADINGIRAFVPASQVSTKYIENLSEYVGKPMRLKVLEVDKQRKRIVASQKQVMLAEAAAEKRAKWEALVVGSKIPGIVRRITDFGAFVDIGGIDGLVHVTDAAWGRVKHPSDVFTIGQEIEVLVLNVDVDKERVSLGYKQLQPKPWTMAEEKYPVGSIVEGKVVRIVPFGAFVALESTIDGLIHISQVGVRRIARVEDEIKVGDVVRCKVLEVNSEAKRISLSRKEAILEENPEVAQQIESERAERDRQYAERQEERSKQREQQSSGQQQRSRERSFDRAPSAAPASSGDSERRDRSYDRRRRNNEDGDYELPPVQEATTSLADLFKGFKTDEE